jgi:molybdopterin-guanine dinucleotide biosynthesis protein B
LHNVIGIAGFSNSGKTTLICRLVESLRDKGMKIGVIKHDAHGHYKEAQGTDSAKFLNSGADTVIIAGAKTVVNIQVPSQEPTLEELVANMPGQDLILVEGYKRSAHPKLVVFLEEGNIEILKHVNGEVVGVASAFNYEHENDEIPVFDLNDIQAIQQWLMEFIRKLD